MNRSEGLLPSPIGDLSVSESDSPSSRANILPSRRTRASSREASTPQDRTRDPNDFLSDSGRKKVQLQNHAQVGTHSRSSSRLSHRSDPSEDERLERDGVVTEVDRFGRRGRLERRTGRNSPQTAQRASTKRRRSGRSRFGTSSGDSTETEEEEDDDDEEEEEDENEGKIPSLSNRRNRAFVDSEIIEIESEDESPLQPEKNVSGGRNISKGTERSVSISSSTTSADSRSKAEAHEQFHKLVELAKKTPSLDNANHNEQSDTSPNASSDDTSDDDRDVGPLNLLPPPLPPPTPGPEFSQSSPRGRNTIVVSDTPSFGSNSEHVQPTSPVITGATIVEPAYDASTYSTIHGLPAHALPPVHSAAVLADAVQRTLNRAPPSLTSIDSKKAAKALLIASANASSSAMVSALIGPAGLMASGNDSSCGNGLDLGKKTDSVLGATGAEPIDASDATALDWRSVGGLDEHIQTLHEMIVLPLMHPEIFERFNISPPRGVLFTGPPGTGKTLTARALAGICSKLLTKAAPNSPPKRVSFFMRKGADCLSKWVGEAERQLRVLFEEAKKLQPSIIFFDEIDGLAPVRSARQDQIHASIVSTLLAMMDGLDSRGQVIVIGATNRVDAIDPALRRPGRFDRELLFSLPTLVGREQILQIHTRGWNPPVDPSLLSELARRTAGYCGADLRALCTDASTRAVRRAFPISTSPMNMFTGTSLNDERIHSLDLSDVSVTRNDFYGALTSIVPASARTGASPAVSLEIETTHDTPAAGTMSESSKKGESKTLLPAISSSELRKRQRGVWAKPLLVDTLEILKKILSYHIFPCGVPPKGKSEAVYASSSQGVVPSLRPRLLVHGNMGCGQLKLGAALLREFEEYPVFSIHLPHLLSDMSARSPEEACVSLFTEAARNAPSIIHWPSCDTWWMAAPPSLRVILSLLLGDLPSSGKPVFLLATSETKFKFLPSDMRALFSDASPALDLPSRHEEGMHSEDFDSLRHFLFLSRHNVLRNADLGLAGIVSNTDPLGTDAIEQFASRLKEPYDVYFSSSSDAGATTSLILNVEPFVSAFARMTDFFAPLVEAILSPLGRYQGNPSNLNPLGETYGATSPGSEMSLVSTSKSASLPTSIEANASKPKSVSSKETSDESIDLVEVRDEEILLLHLRLVLRSICSHLCRFYRDFIEEPLHDTSYRSTGDDVFLVDISMRINSNYYLCVREFLRDIDRIVTATKSRLDLHTAHGRGLLTRAFSMQDTALTMCLAIDRDLALACEVMAVSRRKMPLKPRDSGSVQQNDGVKDSRSIEGEKASISTKEDNVISVERENEKESNPSANFSSQKSYYIPPYVDKRIWNEWLQCMDLIATFPDNIAMLESLASQSYILILSALKQEKDTVEFDGSHRDRTEIVTSLNSLFRIRLKEMWMRRNSLLLTNSSDEEQSYTVKNTSDFDFEGFCKKAVERLKEEEKVSNNFRLDLTTAP